MTIQIQVKKAHIFLLQLINIVDTELLDFLIFWCTYILPLEKEELNSSSQARYICHIEFEAPLWKVAN